MIIVKYILLFISLLLIASVLYYLIFHSLFINNKSNHHKYNYNSYENNISNNTNYNNKKYGLKSEEEKQIDYENNKFAILRRNCKGCVFSHYIVYLGCLLPHLRNGYIPIIE